MKLEASASASILTCEERPFSLTPGGPTLIQRDLTLRFEGHLIGDGVLKELKVEFSPQRAVLQGLMRFSGRLDSMVGTFALTHRGKWIKGHYTATDEVIPGAATGGFKGLRGKFFMDSQLLDKMAVVFYYSFA